MGRNQRHRSQRFYYSRPKCSPIGQSSLVGFYDSSPHLLANRLPRFSEARVNWAENMLTCRSDTKVALVEASASYTLPVHLLSVSLSLVEPLSENTIPNYRKCTYADLYKLVADIASALLHYGLKPGDRVASYTSNCIVSHLRRSRMYTSISSGKCGSLSRHNRPRWYMGQRRG
ncbi:hypothetical protein FA15DRAFT_472442 [Coprinopsis marcescibilis]|uniref:Uncharacterized protein n=1 Tax=Coprinopsis marcescibilis TaxID=230819 RepID=A0A5C3L4Z9_COPMA|nr:hypothetical protein FA15DRAFT_472442 [Coprinopsis marcescibilis]